MTNVSFYEYSKLNLEEKAALLRRSETDISAFIEKVAPILEAVRTEGDKALARFGRELDKADVTEANLKVTAGEFDAAFKLVDASVIESVQFGIDNIRKFHEEQKPEAMWLKEIRPGAFAGDRFTPIQSVALYVPRGKGSFPSVTMMTSVPAVVAGVSNLAIVTLVAARLAGVETVYKVGGAQAVAAVAYGTETIKPALKIVGPGSPWVVAAKRLLSGVIDTGLPAGPSEVMVLADDTVHGGLAALDLLIEAEHGPDSSAYLVTHSRRVAEEALAALPEHWAKMTEQRVAFSTAVLSGKSGGIVLTSSIEESYEFVNAYAPEHLELLSEEPFIHLGHITEASEVLMGLHTPVSIANFSLGPNAVLPTSRWARTFGPLSVSDFVKRSSIGYVTAPAYPEFAKHSHNLAIYEGFSSHALAVSPVRDRYLKQGA
jgi:histidinol dehydrogenase